MKSEYRLNRLTGEWVIFAPSRRKRPMDFVREKCIMELPAYDAGCPFCPGNETGLTEVLFEYSADNSPGWSARAVYNKYPALNPDGETIRSWNGMYLGANGFGFHLVLVESPRHDLHMGSMNSFELGKVLEAYRQSYMWMARDHRVMLTMIFKNHGPSAGASLVHPHSQLVASGIVPKYIRDRENEAQKYFDEMGRCIMCDILAFELVQNERVVYMNSDFVCLVPYAAETPFELWIAPRRHMADFQATSDTEIMGLGVCLQWSIQAMERKLGHPDYNLTINSCTRFRENEPQLHWYMRIVPKLTTRAGFEIGSGMCINPSLPEADAEFLRS